ncbi:MAG TPA: DUF2937 family protein [Opitutaceae bacterium]|jgi:hypothetical protein
MAWARPVRSVLWAGEGLLDRLLALAGAAAFSQIPEFMQQYLQRLGGHLDEAQRQLAQFKDAAAASGLTIDQLAHRTSQDADSGIARLSTVIHGAIARVAQLSADETAIREASIPARPFVFLRHADPQIARATWHVFRPAFPTTLEGLGYALVGFLFLICFYHGAVKRPVRRAWQRRRTIATAAVGLFAAMLLGTALHAQGPSALTEPEIKAAFLFHFTQFVDWPSDAFANARSPMMIGVAGDDGIEDVLERIVKGEHWEGRPLLVCRVHTAEDAAGCQLLYIAPGSERLVQSGELKNKPVLTVGSTETFLRDGGMIRFVPDRSRLRLRINVQAAREASLSISAALLRLAEITPGEPHA